MVYAREGGVKMYAPLWCKTNYSFLEGASHPEELVEEAHRLGLRSLAITDRDGLYGIVRAHVKAKELGIHLIIGAEVSVGEPINPKTQKETPCTKVILLAQNRAGYSELCKLLTVGRRRSHKGVSRVLWPEVCAHSEGVIALWVGEGDAKRSAGLPEMKAVFGDRLYAMLPRHLLAEEQDREAHVRAHAAMHRVPLVACNEVLYHTRARRPLQDVLTCIRHGTTLSTAGRVLRGNSEYDLKNPHLVNALFRDDEAALARTLEIAERCTFSMDEIRYRYPSERLPDGKTTTEWLRDLTMDGARKRYGGEIPDDTLAQLNKELDLIEYLDYGGYFLTMWDIVQTCHAKNILCQGRGSAANSAVCFCLGITAVDPVRMGLLFERFLSKERAEPPDIDLDIEHDRREEVIQHMYTKYGRNHAAMVANVIRYRSRSAIRDVGKALGLRETDLDRVTKLLSHYHDDDVAGVLEQSGMDVKASVYSQLSDLSTEILDFPRHLSIHPGGFLLGHEPVSTLVPIENATMENRTVIQWDKDDVEALGLFKVDLLGLGALSHLHRCFDLLSKHRGVELSSATVPDGDTKTYDMICRGDTVGVFQIESRAQMAMLPRLLPRTYYDIVIQVSIVRPGPITGGMVHPYLRRRSGEEEVDYPHECLIPVLKKTLGIPLFQEQVMKLAVVAADYTPGEADQLRRDMAAWRRSGRMEGHRERLIARMKAKGIAEEFAERVFKQICGFGEYGFPESHAASFALISYVGSYLKCHYPEVFTCGLLNSLPMGFYAASTLVEDAKRHRVEVRPIDIAMSEWDCTLEGRAIRMGARYVKGLQDIEWKRVADARSASRFVSVEDITIRAGINERSLVALAESGAFAPLQPSRRNALWESKGLAASPAVPMPVETESVPAFQLMSDAESIHWDYQRTGHSTHGHPLGPLRAQLRRQNLPDAKTLYGLRDGQYVHYAGLVICRQRPGTASGVTFMTLEDETGFVNVVLWKDTFEKNSIIAKTQSFLGVSGKLQVQDGVIHLVADKLWRPDTQLTPTIQSRDFH
ncbi:MAG: error-prone DNA polymerase [Sandaracinaceae bacterium]|nr:error-prone DNA polymerase [Sandaracinaceae bacterium]